jgi:hypothetical protein
MFMTQFFKIQKCTVTGPGLDLKRKGAPIIEARYV